MIDFLVISTKSTKRGVVEIYPKFIIKKSNDLMIRGGDFYAIWVEDLGLWSTDEQDALQIIDRELDKYAEANKDNFDCAVKVLHMWDAESGMIDAWHKYCQKQMRDSFHMLDEKLIFSNTPTNKRDYASKKLQYPLEKGPTSAYDRLMDVLYSKEERHKIEWAIGSVVSGDSKKLQKFMVLYGAAGTGKSTVLNIIQQLFDGYYSVFDAKALGSSSNSFALESFKSNPLVAIQHDGDLSKIEDNTRLNSLVSHEIMTVNEKFKSTYANRFKCFLFMGTNKPVRITDAKSGLIRRLIDVSPTGDKLEPDEYRKLVKQIAFELGAVAYKCKDIYLEDPDAYDTYIPVSMLGASNDFYNFVLAYYHVFKSEDGTTLKEAWERYRKYCEDANVAYPFTLRVFKEELKNYFRDFKERLSMEDGSRVRSYYEGFREDIFLKEKRKRIKSKTLSSIIFKEQPSIFDKECGDYPAQYANDNGTPLRKWSEVITKLSDLDTSRLHYVKVPENHIVIDFDILDENGEKSLERNIEAASKFTPTYAELSKSGKGVHLHYIYLGDPNTLKREFDDHIEIKVFRGKSSLRRMLTKCNDIPISKINTGLPIKEERKMINIEVAKNVKTLRSRIERNLRKEIWPNTKPSIDLIFKELEDAYNSGLRYDVSDMRHDILQFALSSTHQADKCLKIVNKMHFKSDDIPEVESSLDPRNDGTGPLVFYDVEVFPNLFLINWKYEGENKPVVRMINPKPSEVEELLHFKLIGFNCRRYDNHILYARLMGYSNEQLYKLSQKIISGDTNAFFSEAYKISYTDVYDFSSKKQSLKKFEIELGIHHQELGLPWDEPVPEKLWQKVAEYCDNDVLATEAVFNARKSDFVARTVLADIAKMSVNDTTNSLSARIIFGKERHPQKQFNYRNLGEMTDDATNTVVTKDNILYPEFGDEYTVFDKNGRPIFPGYKFDRGVSTYRDEEVGEGGYVWSIPGMYTNVALLDIASMHPSSIIAEQLFGELYTKRFEDLVNARLAIKHHDYENAKKMLDGALTDYILALEKGDAIFSADDLAQALKIVINSVYGLTAAQFDNPFRDIRNIDNIVAKRGALFMVNLKHEVTKKGFTVAHIKTDSIKIPNATQEIIDFVTEYGKIYGYNFEHEATYDRMCLVNDAVYIAKYDDQGIRTKGGKHANEWTATGTQFQVPYVFKKLFSKEQIEFDDLCETKAVTSALYLKAKDPEKPEFIGRVGRFTPIKPGCGGKELLRENKDKDGNVKYSAAVGTKGYFWLESEVVKVLHKENDIDYSYYDRLVDEAVKAISEFGDFEWFVSDDKKDISSDTVPWSSPCGEIDIPCSSCKHCTDGSKCDKGYDISNQIIKKE
jgi:DNA polymerase elongation subunit (family B)/energy-coupling factor transporter ATP-binding protein EcfA2